MERGTPTYTIGQVAGSSGVSTRTLRYYDHIGLLNPSLRTDAGYRRYSLDDCERLRDILVLRELGVGLGDMPAILERYRNRGDATEFLRVHLDKLYEKRGDLTDLIAAVERAIAARKQGVPMSTDKMFNGFNHDPHEAEARARWGESDAYKESARRVKTYGPEDWSRYESEAAAVNERFLACMDSGVAPDAPDAKAAAEAHRLLIDRWFYPTSHQMHAGLGAMYVSDARFTANIDKAGVGLAAFMSAAIAANSADHGAPSNIDGDRS